GFGLPATISGTGFTYDATTHTNIDGTQITRAQQSDASGNVTERSVTTVSADGSLKIMRVDTNNAGWFNFQETVVTESDAEVITTIDELNPDGSIKDSTEFDRSPNRRRVTLTDKHGVRIHYRIKLLDDDEHNPQGGPGSGHGGGSGGSGGSGGDGSGGPGSGG